MVIPSGFTLKCKKKLSQLSIAKGLKIMLRPHSHRGTTKSDLLKGKHFWSLYFIIEK